MSGPHPSWGGRPGQCPPLSLGGEGPLRCKTPTPRVLYDQESSRFRSSGTTHSNTPLQRGLLPTILLGGGALDTGTRSPRELTLYPWEEGGSRSPPLDRPFHRRVKGLILCPREDSQRTAGVHQGGSGVSPVVVTTGRTGPGISLLLLHSGP